MNREEAKEVLAGHLARYRSWPYHRLAERVGSYDAAQVAGPSGAAYQLEVVFSWDAAPGGSIRVIGSVDDGGLRAFAPLSDDFILAPDGGFVGE